MERRVWLKIFCNSSIRFSFGMNGQMRAIVSVFGPDS